MSTEATKYVVTSFFSKLNAGQYDEAFQLVDEKVGWWVPGNLPFSGTRTKAEYLGIVQMIRQGFPSGFALDLKSMVGEGEKVAAEVESRGTHVNGRAYNNKYHFLFDVRDGRIVFVKEYMDTLHLAQLMAP